MIKREEVEAQRYVVLKASGSRYAYVNDTQEGRTVKRYDIFKGDGWTLAEKHAAKLNAALVLVPEADSGGDRG